VTEAQSGDIGNALAYYEKAISYDRTHPDAVAALERAARDRGDWKTVAELMAAREASEPDAKKRLAIAVELAQLYRQKLGRPLDAVPYLERAASIAPEEAPAVEALAALYFAAGRTGDAEPLYRRLAEKAKAARKPKDVARYQQRLGSLREITGDQPEALKA